MRHWSDLIDDNYGTFPERTEPERLQRLKDFLSRRRPEQTAGDLLRILDEFAANAGHAARTDAEGGYLGDVLADTPGAAREVASLRCDDDAGNVRLDELRERARRKSPGECVSEDLLRQISHWVRTLATHRHQENRLINESLSRDTGGES